MSLCALDYLKKRPVQLHGNFRTVYPWLGPPRLQHNTLSTSGFVDDVTFAHSGSYGRWLMARILKVTH